MYSLLFKFYTKFEKLNFFSLKKYIVLFLLLIANRSLGQNGSIFDVARKGSLAEIELAYKNDSEIINAIDDNKSSVLLLACYRGNTDVALFLADKVKDINYNSGMGTAVMAAVMSGNITILQKLIACKANLDLSDSNGKTALIYATFFNKNEIVKVLLQAGASKQQKDGDNRTALDYATLNKNTELIILLTDNLKN